MKETIEIKINCVKILILNVFCVSNIQITKSNLSIYLSVSLIYIYI